MANTNKEKGLLTKILRDLVAQSERTAKPAWKRLGNGLIVRILVNAKTGLTNVELEREEKPLKYPSGTEVKTIRDHWPYVLPQDLNIMARSFGHRKFYQMHWPTPKREAVGYVQDELMQAG